MVKVNDLKLAQIKKTVRLVGVDISLSGLLRRLGILAPVETLSRVLPLRLAERTITWNYVEPIQVVKSGTATGQLTAALAGAGATTSIGVSGVVPKVQLNISHTKLADLRPADIADILEQLDVEDAGAMLDRLDTETAADALNAYNASKCRSGKSIPIGLKVLREFEQQPGGLYLPRGLVSKRVHGNRIKRVAWKIVATLECHNLPEGH